MKDPFLEPHGYTNLWIVEPAGWTIRRPPELLMPGGILRLATNDVPVPQKPH